MILNLIFHKWKNNKYESDLGRFFTFEYYNLQKTKKIVQL